MVTVRELITPLVSGISTNDCLLLKAYLESDAASAAQHASSIEYLYGYLPPDPIRSRRTAATARSTRIPPGCAGSQRRILHPMRVVSSMMDTKKRNSIPAPERRTVRHPVRRKAGRWPEH